MLMKKTRDSRPASRLVCHLPPRLTSRQGSGPSPSLVPRPASRLASRLGFGTLEIVIIIAVLLSIALIFRQTLTGYASDLINSVFKASIIEDINNDNT